MHYISKISFILFTLTLLRSYFVEGTYQGERLFLIEAVKDGNIEVLKWLLKKEAFINIKDESGRTPLMIAAGMTNGLNLVKTLLEAGADADLTDDNGTSSLHFAALNGSTDTVNFLKDRVDYLLYPDNDGKTAVHLAAEGGHIEILTSLLEYLKDPRDVEGMFDNEGNTPVHLSATYEHQPVLEFFKNASVNLDVKNNKDGSTPLSLVALQGSKEMVNFLVNSGANVNAVDNRMRSPLHEICYLVGDVEIVEILINHNAAVDLPDLEGKTPLYLALSEGLYHTSKVLLKKGADLNLTDFSGNSMLHAAAYSGSVKLTTYLIIVGKISPEVKNKNGTTPLIIASQKGHLAVVKTLYKFGGNVTKANQKGFTVMHAAALSGNIELIKYLMEKGISLNEKDYQGMIPLHFAAMADEWLAVKLLIEKITPYKVSQSGESKSDCVNCYKCVTGIKDSHGRTPLYLAAENGHLQTVEVLLESGSDCKIKDNNGISSFQAATRNGKLNVMQFIVFWNCDIESKDNSGRTALFFAAEEGQVGSLLFLLERGSDVTIEIGGETIMHAAAKKGHLEIIKVLGAYNDLIDAYDNDGKSPAWYAAFEGKLGCLSQLINLGALATNQILVAAVKGGHLDVVKYLIWNGGDINSVDSSSDMPDRVEYRMRLFSDLTLLQMACQFGHRDVAEFLIDCGSNISVITQDKYKMTLLHIAAQNGRVAIIDLLLSLGMDINTIDGDLLETPLHYAVKNDQVESLKFLLDHDANPNITNILDQTLIDTSIQYNSVNSFDYLKNIGYDIMDRSDGKNIYHILVENKAIKIIEYLINSESSDEKLNAGDNDGNRPMHYGVDTENVDIIKVLVKGGVDVNAKNKNNETPLWRALDKSIWSAAKCLLKYGSKIRQEDINMAERRYYSFFNLLIEIRNNQKNPQNLEC